jgi:hypothetical protein
MLKALEKTVNPLKFSLKASEFSLKTGFLPQDWAKAAVDGRRPQAIVER